MGAQMTDKLLWFGSLLALSAVLGFSSVADDLRHVNELAAISAVFLLGVAFVAISIRAKRMHYPLPESRALWSGIVLTLFGILGFGFVADDVEHVGEIAACAALLLSGITLLFLHWWKHRLPSAN